MKDRTLLEERLGLKYGPAWDDATSAIEESRKALVKWEGEVGEILPDLDDAIAGAANMDDRPHGGAHEWREYACELEAALEALLPAARAAYDLLDDGGWIANLTEDLETVEDVIAEHVSAVP